MFFKILGMFLAVHPISFFLKFFHPLKMVFSKIPSTSYTVSFLSFFLLSSIFLFLSSHKNSIPMRPRMMEGWRWRTGWRIEIGVERMMGKSEGKKEEKEKKKDLSWRESWGNGMLKQTERNPIKDIDVWLESRQVSLISFFVLVQKKWIKNLFSS